MTSVNRDLVMDGLAELSSEPLQRLRWLCDGSSEVSSFVEAIEELYTDSGLADALDEGDLVFSSKLDTKLRILDRLVSRVDTRMAPAAVISHPAMDAIRQSASEILSMMEN